MSDSSSRAVEVGQKYIVCVWVTNLPYRPDGCVQGCSDFGVHENDPKDLGIRYTIAAAAPDIALTYFAKSRCRIRSKFVDAVGVVCFFAYLSKVFLEIYVQLCWRLGRR